MIGRTVVARPVGAGRLAACLAAALALVGLAFAIGARQAALAALLPAALGAAWAVASARAFRVRFAADRLEMQHPARVIRYASLRDVWPLPPAQSAEAPRPLSYPLELVYDGGSVRIPADLSEPTERVLAFLSTRLPARRGAPLAADLASWCAEQQASFGSDRVFAFRARSRPVRSTWPHVGATAVGIAVAGGAWIAAGLTPWASGAWIGVGVVALVAAALMAVERHHALVGQGPVPDAGSGLVIGPTGLALHHGALRGQVKWAEVVDVAFRRQASFVTTGAAGARPAVVLKVPGAEIPVFDVYDRPLAEIHQRILGYWR